MFDLGASCALPKLTLWDEKFSGIESMTVSVSDSLGFGAAVGRFNPCNNPQGANYPAEVFNLGGAVGHRVKLDLRCPQLDFRYNGCSLSPSSGNPQARTVQLRPCAFARYIA